MDDDAGISDELKTQLQESINGLFDRYLDKYNSGRNFHIFKKSIEHKITFKDAFALAKKSADYLIEDLKKQTPFIIRQFIERARPQMQSLQNTESNIQTVIGYVCDFVDHIEITFGKTILSPKFVFHDRQGKIFSITEDLYCPAQSLFIILMYVLCKDIIIVRSATPGRPSRHVKFEFDDTELKPATSSFAANQEKCIQYYKNLQKTPESQGGSKSRRIRRRKHARKTHHKRASKSHKRRRHSRLVRKHKKHTRR